MKHSVALLGLLLLLATTACNSGGKNAPGPGVSSDGFPAPDQEIVYHTAIGVLARYGHTPDTEQSSPTTGVIVTRWKNSLQPFSRQGYREQITVTITPCPGRASYFTTETQVVRQRNANMQDPGSLVAAKWKGSEPCVEVEKLVNGQIAMAFLPGSLSPEFRQRHGLQQMDDASIPSRDIRRPIGR